jgi:hypothetical protein
MSSWQKRKARATEKFLQAQAEHQMQRIGLPVLVDRACGKCTACCTTNEIIAGLNKLGNVPCRHLQSGGCGIYEQRPHECKHYFCGYRRGLTSQRPDQCGLVLTFTHHGIIAAEVWPGAAVASRELLETLQRQQGNVSVEIFLTPAQAAEAYARRMFPSVKMGQNDWQGFVKFMDELYLTVSRWAD